MKKALRLAAVLSTAILSVSSVAMFAGCSTAYPEVTLTFEFNDKEYDVTFELSRKGAPQTVQHFIELVDAGYYEGTVIHNYDKGGLIYGGAYTYDASEQNSKNKLIEKDYWTTLKSYEEAHNYKFTQTVYTNLPSGESEGLYTLHGEFKNNGVEKNDKSLSQIHQGTLVMEYMDKGSDNTKVATIRNDNGKNNDGEEYQQGDDYKYNSATSMFSIMTNSTSRREKDNTNCAFGETKDFEELRALLDAISDYEDTLSDETTFTESVSGIVLNQYDPIDSVRNAKITVTYEVPILPITIVRAKVKKY